MLSTHLQNMLVKLDHFSPNFKVEDTKYIGISPPNLPTRYFWDSVPWESQVEAAPSLLLPIHQSALRRPSMSPAGPELMQFSQAGHTVQLD